MTTTNDLDAIETRAAAATEGPWIEEHSAEAGSCVIPHDAESTREAVARTFLYESVADAEFIAHARTDVPALVAEIRELREWQRAVAVGTGYANEVGGMVEIAPADVIVEAVRTAEQQAAEGVELQGAAEQLPEMSAFPANGAEFAAWWNTWTAEHRDRFVAGYLDASQTAKLCIMQDHQGAMHQLRVLEQNYLDRIRLDALETYLDRMPGHGSERRRRRRAVARIENALRWGQRVKLGGRMHQKRGALR
jgi:hypothetical protein